jgi:hypothetical protein
VKIKDVLDMYRNQLKICNLSLENFHGPFIEAVMKTDSKHGEEYDICDKPYALFRHISEFSRFEHKLIKTQMAQIDSLIEPELHETLRLLAEHLLKLWIMSTESVKNYETFFYLEA